MKEILLVVGVLTLLMGLASAQLYRDKQDVLVNSMDRMIVEHHDQYADVPIAGADEDVKPQDVRYEQMTVPQNEVNERHFQDTANLKTVTENLKDKH